MKYKYTGKSELTDKARKRGVQPYLPDPSLVKALDLAINLGRPLLLQGEPGCGKTQLAFHLSYELGRLNKLPEGADWPLEIWPVQSISRARDGMYKYDAIGRLSDAQLAKLNEREARPTREFIKLGALGNAISPMDKDKERYKNKRVIVLIDEIDKADIDFPNDLLWVLDEDEFLIPELTGTPLEKLTANKTRKPIVIITSNREKELPGPFLRRCFYHFIKFPAPSTLKEILAAHVPDLEKNVRELVVSRFIQLKDDMVAKNLPGKKPSTSELIDWAKALQLYEKGEDVLADLAAMEKDLSRTPHKNTLLKDVNQVEAYEQKQS